MSTASFKPTMRSSGQSFLSKDLATTTEESRAVIEGSQDGDNKNRKGEVAAAPHRSSLVRPGGSSSSSN